jgi:hypothetical protein
VPFARARTGRAGRAAALAGLVHTDAHCVAALRASRAAPAPRRPAGARAGRRLTDGQKLHVDEPTVSWYDPVADALAACSARRQRGTLRAGHADGLSGAVDVGAHAARLAAHGGLGRADEAQRAALAGRLARARTERALRAQVRALSDTPCHPSARGTHRLAGLAQRGALLRLEAAHGAVHAGALAAARARVSFRLARADTQRQKAPLVQERALRARDAPTLSSARLHPGGQNWKQPSGAHLVGSRHAGQAGGGARGVGDAADGASNAQQLAGLAASGAMRAARAPAPRQQRIAAPCVEAQRAHVARGLPGLRLAAARGAHRAARGG